MTTYKTTTDTSNTTQPTRRLLYWEARCSSDDPVVTTLTPEQFAEEQFDAELYRDDSTTWVEIGAIDADTDEEVHREVRTVDPHEPECRSEVGEHDWGSPHPVLGGRVEDPGVWGTGGGVRITEVCCHCGIYRTGGSPTRSSAATTRTRASGGMAAA